MLHLKSINMQRNAENSANDYYNVQVLKNIFNILSIFF